MIIAIVLLFFAGLTFGAGGMHEYQKGLIARKEAAIIAAEAKLAEAVAKGLLEAENKLVDMQASFEVGEQQAKIIERKIYLQGQTYVKNTPAVNNPACVIDGAGVSIIDSKIRSLQRAAAAETLGISLPSANGGEQQGNPDGGALSEVSGRDGDVPRVPGQTTESAAVATVPGTGVPRPAKPKSVN